jgi:hypothetical protein
MPTDLFFRRTGRLIRMGGACAAALGALAACSLEYAGPPERPLLVVQAPVSGPPVVRIASPSANDVVLQNVELVLQALVANAGSDIARVDLSVDGAVLQALASPNPTGEALFAVDTTWLASTPGPHTFSVTAFRADGTASNTASVTFTVVSSDAARLPESTGEAGIEAATTLIPAAPPDAALPAASPATPQPDEEPAAGSEGTTTATGTFIQLINVRSEPGLGDNIIGSFRPGDTAPVVGRNAAGTWYRVRYGSGDSGGDGFGWVSATFVELDGDPSTLPIIE